MLKRSPNAAPCSDWANEQWSQHPENQPHLDLDIDEGEVKIGGEFYTPSSSDDNPWQLANLNMKQPAADKRTETSQISSGDITIFDLL